MSPEAENIFEMPPHLFWGSCPFWAKLRMAGSPPPPPPMISATGTGQCRSYGGGDKANPIGSGSSLHSAGGSSSLPHQLCYRWLFVCPSEAGQGD